MEETGVKLAIDSFTKWTLPQIKSYLGKCIEILDDYPDNGTAVNELHVSMDNIRTLEAEEAVEREQEEDDDDEYAFYILTSSAMIENDDEESKRTLESFLSKRATKNSKRGLLVVPNFSSPIKQTPLQKQIFTVYEYLKSFFAKALRPPGELVFHESVYYDRDVRYIKAFRFDQRATLRSALLDHKMYLDCTCAVDDMFDIGFAFKIFQEAGTQVNVYDWYVAFGSILNVQGGMKEGEVFARFARSVSELEFLGLLRWGGGKRSDFCHKLVHW
jgi:hypothetical protein